MTRAFVSLVLVLAFGSACSTSDQSLGETRRQIDVDPEPEPSDPDPVLYPCEDESLHKRTGICLEAAVCKDDVITLAGFECGSNQVCCNQGVGTCPVPPCQ